MFNKLWRRLASIYEPVTDQSSLKDNYAVMPLDQLEQLDSKQLTPSARALRLEELERRKGIHKNRTD